MLVEPQNPVPLLAPAARVLHDARPGRPLHHPDEDQTFCGITPPAPLLRGHRSASRHGPSTGLPTRHSCWCASTCSEGNMFQQHRQAIWISTGGHAGSPCEVECFSFITRPLPPGVRHAPPRGGPCGQGMRSPPDGGRWPDRAIGAAVRRSERYTAARRRSLSALAVPSDVCQRREGVLWVELPPGKSRQRQAERSADTQRLTSLRSADDSASSRWR